jgi:hypothetical protein
MGLHSYDLSEFLATELGHFRILIEEALGLLSRGKV